MAKQGIGAYYSSWEVGIYDFSSDSRYVSYINFKVFSNDARIQIHGCNPARDTMPGNTLVEDAMRFKMISVESTEACAKLQTNIEPAVPITKLDSHLQ